MNGIDGGPYDIRFFLTYLNSLSGELTGIIPKARLKSGGGFYVIGENILDIIITTGTGFGLLCIFDFRFIILSAILVGIACIFGIFWLIREYKQICKKYKVS